MNVFKCCLVSIVVSCVVFMTVSVAAQEAKTVTIADILKNAKCPLTGDQAKKLKEFKPGGDRGAFRAVYELFDENQIKALKETFGTSPGRDGGPERPRFVFFAVIFENEGCPLTDAQVKAIKALPGGQGMFQQLQDIFTAKQLEITQAMFNR